jgi:predicted CXXCH cytochrome family protein
MSKEHKPVPYEGRIRDTKGVAQRLDLDYFRRPDRFRDLKRKLMWIAPLAAAALAAPFLAGLGPAEKVFSNGPVSRAHAIFEKNCSVCHEKAFSSVADASCLKCHDGPSHPAKAVDTAVPLRLPRCVSCHVEHQRGKAETLSSVASANCTSCHGSLEQNAKGVRLKSFAISAFEEGKHPGFPAAGAQDARPLKLNHAAHMPVQAKNIRGMKLPMKCGDCHATRKGSAKGELAPVTFDEHCRACHKRELEFLLPGLPAEAPAAPHTKDGPVIRQFILETYQNLLNANPSLAARPLDRDMVIEQNAAVWLAKAASMSERYLFERKCTYCHEYDGPPPEFPAVKPVGSVTGLYDPANAEGRPWFERGEFSHRAHRAVDCASCHFQARASTKTSDILIPGLPTCAACHGASGTAIDNCSQCHQYHNKLKELDKDRRPLEQLIGWLLSPRRTAEGR